MSTQNPSIYIEEEYQKDKQMCIFMPVFHTDIIEMVKSVPSNSSKLDPIPAKILKDHIGALAYRIAKIINTSLDQGYVCDSLEEGILRALIKSSQLDLLFPNFRSVSNLAYLGKLAECFVWKQLMGYAELMGMMEPYQSGYRWNFSTETAFF